MFRACQAARPATRRVDGPASRISPNSGAVEPEGGLLLPLTVAVGRLAVPASLLLRSTVSLPGLLWTTAAQTAETIIAASIIVSSTNWASWSRRSSSELFTGPPLPLRPLPPLVFALALLPLGPDAVCEGEERRGRSDSSGCGGSSDWSAPSPTLVG